MLYGYILCASHMGGEPHSGEVAAVLWTHHTQAVLRLARQPLECARGRLHLAVGVHLMAPSPSCVMVGHGRERCSGLSALYSLPSDVTDSSAQRPTLLAPSSPACPLTAGCS